MSARAWERRRAVKRGAVIFNKAFKKLEREHLDYVMMGDAVLMSPAHYAKCMRLVDALDKYVESDFQDWKRTRG